MRVQSINNCYKQPTMKAGTYFTDSDIVIFNTRDHHYCVPKEILGVSEDGFEYIKDTTTSQEIKDRFTQIPFIKKLSEKFDVFVWFREVPLKDDRSGHYDNLSFATILWADPKYKYAQDRKVEGRNTESQELATEKMFENLENGKFCRH